MKIDLTALLNNPSSLSERFHHKTKIKKFNKEIPYSKWPESWKKTYYKGYGRLKEIRMPAPSLPSGIGLKKTFEKRESKRQFSNKKLSLKEISTILYYSTGLKNPKQDNGKRYYPSAGARYPIETYMVSLNTDLDRGLYHYYLKTHSLEQLRTDSFHTPDYFNQEWVMKSSFLIILTALFKRTTIKYGDRGYRSILIEAGHIGQNIYLTSTAIQASCCAIGGFVDDSLNGFLDIDGINESVVYVLAIGKE